MKGDWVRVKDDLPPIGQYVLVAPDCGIGVRCQNEPWGEDPNAEWNEDPSGWHWETDGEGLRISRVTHWHPISGPEHE